MYVARFAELETLAANACLSPFHFHRVFRGMVGETPLELARRLRIERAARHLLDSDRAVTEIAFDAGYETHEAFTRAFRGCYSTSPSGFRERRHPQVEIAAPCGVHYSTGERTPAFIPRDSRGRNMEVEIKDMPELRVSAVRHVGPYNQIPEAFERLGAIAGPAGLFQQLGAACLGIFHDGPESTPADELRSDAAIVVPDGVPMPGELTEQRLPAGRYAHTLHIGSYEELGDVWVRFMGEWLPDSGHRMGDGVSYEIYLNDPTQVPKEELRTELYIPIA